MSDDILQITDGSAADEVVDDVQEETDDDAHALTDDLFHRIDEEFEDSSDYTEIADSDGPAHLAVSGGDTVSIMEGPYDDNPGSAFASEFDEILDRHAAVNAAFPTNDLDAYTQLQAQQRAAENAIAPFTCINPASADRGNLGQSVLLKPGRTISTSVFADGEPQLVANWPGDDREACPVVVTAAPALPYSSNIARIVAKIQWGVHGAKFEVLVDVGTGFELTISASNVYLSLYLEGGDFTTSGAATETDTLASGAIGFQQADHQQAVVRSVRSAGLVTGAGGGFTVSRPAFATSLLSFERSDTGGPTTLTFRDQNNTTIFVRQYAALAYVGAPISLPSEIASVFVTNGGADSKITLVFGLF